MSAQSQQPVRGSYWRDPAGLWRYLIGGQPVPGARDVTAEERYPPCPRVDRGGRRWVLLEPDWVSGPRARAELAGLAGGLLQDAGGLMAAEDAVLADPGVVVDLYAPELALDALIGMADIAASPARSRPRCGPGCAVVSCRHRRDGSARGSFRCGRGRRFGCGWWHGARPVHLIGADP